MKTIVLSCTVPGTFVFSDDIVRLLKNEGHKVILMSSEESQLKEKAESLGVEYIHIPFYRGMNPLKDIKAILQERKILKQLNPDLLFGATPKAAMVSMISGKIAGIKKRVYHIYGLPYETAKGFKQKILLVIEKLTGKWATDIIPIGTSVKETTLARGLFEPTKVKQEGFLTIGGVDTSRFNPDKLKEAGNINRQELQIKDDDVVIGYVARFTYDKGFCDLIDIWNRIKSDKRLQLIIVGDMDKRVPLPENIVEDFFKDSRVHNMGYRKDVERMFAAMDIFLFPSYREGFGNVSIEASAMEIPVITYNVTGCKDAVEDDVSGYVVPFKDYDAVVEKITELSNNPELRRKLGKQGRERVEQHFTTSKVAENLIKIIRDL